MTRRAIPSLRHAPGLACVLAGLAPLLVAVPAPLMDWPSHLARVWITVQVLDGDPFWTARYQFQGFLLPNAVLDLAVYGMMRLGMGVGLAGTVFLVLLYGAFVGGAWRLAGRLAGRLGAASAITLPLAVTCFYGTLFFYGLVNFMAGLAAMAWVLSAWIGLADRPVRRAVLAAAATAGIALCHVLAAVIFLGVVACLDLPRLLRSRAGWLGVLAPTAAALVVLAVILALSPVEAGREGGVGFSAGGTVAGLVWRKGVILVRAMASGQPGPDVVMAVTAVALAAAAWWGRATIGWPWVLAPAGLLGLALVAPDTLGEAAFLDARLVPVALLLACVGVRLRRSEAGIATALAALVVLRMGWLAVDWHRAGQQHRALEADLARLPRGSTLLGGLGMPSEALTWREEWSPPSGNVASLAVTHGIFVPTVFASPAQQPLVLREEWRRWRHYRLVETAAQLDAVKAERAGCRTGPVSLLVLHVRTPVPGAAVVGPPGYPYAVLPIC